MAYIQRKGVWRPTTVPTFPVEIDWNHPLSRGLLSLYVPGVSFADITGFGVPLVPSNVAIGGSPDGPQARLNSSASPRLAADAPASLQFSSIGTIFWRGLLLRATTTFNPLFSVSYASTWISPYFSYGIRQGDGNANVAFQYFWNSGGSLQGLNGANVGVSVGMHDTALALNMGSTAVGYRDGAQDASGATTSSISYGAGSQISFGSEVASGSDSDPSQQTSLGAIWGRQLSAYDIAWLHAEPFAMLQPKVQRIWYVPASGPTTISLYGTLLSSFKAYTPISANTNLSAKNTSQFKGKATVLAGAFLYVYGRFGSAFKGRSTVSLSLNLFGRLASMFKGRGAALPPCPIPDPIYSSFATTPYVSSFTNTFQRVIYIARAQGNYMPAGNNLPTLATGQKVTPLFDFSIALPPDVSLVSNPSVTCQDLNNIDPNPSSRVLSQASIVGYRTETNCAVAAQIGNGVAGANYLLTFSATASNTDVWVGWTHMTCVAPS